ncbi:anthranilate synthase component II [Candidatus Blochmannia ocreatus (nom. nud.)]|uniref:Aminodeoxychorismate/anthranilate synthase component II n=1 Tax=Candidatus Blochmannia ocreatus (nom. nud.) TaxID=251538 RepID=A0ABY4SU97_9ENTR|nr:aminodeoxychorismate/anthranilate synthase component II [Candidatus Blochmannia ocreatus]URJ25043.1 aminodeoxychorismate/anthranilate synthase component II [Candidatus Blochmannia ocreatus]
MNKILIIDNYDSFTWNLYQYFREMGKIVQVKRNDNIHIADIKQLSPTHLIISPGPGVPKNAGISLEVIAYFHKILPILGICLGHQAIAQFFGAKLRRAHKIMHGKPSKIYHNNSGVFSGITQPLNVIRYHSWIVETNTLPKCLEITAWNVINNNNLIEIMGIRHKTFKTEGVQFHPESVLSEQGHNILANFL